MRNNNNHRCMDPYTVLPDSLQITFHHHREWPLKANGSSSGRRMKHRQVPQRTTLEFLLLK